MATFKKPSVSPQAISAQKPKAAGVVMSMPSKKVLQAAVNHLNAQQNAYSSAKVDYDANGNIELHIDEKALDALDASAAMPEAKKPTFAIPIKPEPKTADLVKPAAFAAPATQTGTPVVAVNPNAVDPDPATDQLLVTSKEGNKFLVIGAFSDAIRVSIRFWITQYSKERVRVDFRVRFGDRLIKGKPVTIMDAEFAALGPITKAFNGSTTNVPNAGYRSMAGYLQLPVGIIDIKALHSAFLSSAFTHQLCEALKGNGVALNSTVATADSFFYLIKEQVALTLKNKVDPAPADTLLFLGSVHTPLLYLINGENKIKPPKALMAH